MSWAKRYLDSSIGGKSIVALTGVGLFLFVVLHMTGNLLVFAGPDALNSYAAALKSKPALLWPARGGLLFIFLFHIYMTLRLALRNRAARPIPYSHPGDVQLSRASKSMIVTGLMILFFVLYHLAHFTFHEVASTGEHFDALGRPDVYYMVVTGFQQPIISALYIVAMILLGLHLSHGLQSSLQTLGIHHPRYTRYFRCLGPALGWAIALGNISMPLAVIVGIIKLPGGGL